MRKENLRQIGRGGMSRGIAALTLAVALAAGTSPALGAASLSHATVRAWDAYVAATEARIHRELGQSKSGAFLAQEFVRDGARERGEALDGAIPMREMTTRDRDGRDIPVPGGSITHWRGTVLLAGLALDDVLTRAQHPPEHGPFQPDVLALRVLARRPDALTLFIKMTRQKVVTVTYNSEHDVTYHRLDRARAWSRSVATRIAEVEQTAQGERERSAQDDHGFLWRLNSYWRYQQVPQGVLVELESLSLSRDIPTGLRLLTRPLVNSIARESMERTLVAFRSEQVSAAPCTGCGV